MYNDDGKLVKEGYVRNYSYEKETIKYGDCTKHFYRYYRKEDYRDNY